MQLAEIEVSYKPNKGSLVNLNNSEHIYKVVLGNWDKGTLELQEEMKVVLLNRSNQLLGIYTLSKGGISGTMVDVKLLLSVALKCVASHIAVVHNHPSGNLTPSKADVDITTKIKRAAEQVDILLLDHLIITKDGYYSFADHGKL